MCMNHLKCSCKFLHKIETATNEKNVEEDWGIIMNICDKAGKSSEAAKTYLKAIIKRLYNNDPHIGIKAVTVSLRWRFLEAITNTFLLL